MSQGADGCTQREISAAEALKAVFVEGRCRRLYLEREGVAEGGVAEALKTVFAEGGVA